MRTLLRPGRHGLLVRLEGRGGTRFVLANAHRRRRRVFHDLDEAVRSFERVEKYGDEYDSEPRAKLWITGLMKRDQARDHQEA